MKKDTASCKWLHLFLQLAPYFVLFFLQLYVSLHLFLHFHQPFQNFSELLRTFQDFQKVYTFRRSKMSQFHTARAVEISVTNVAKSNFTL